MIGMFFGIRFAWFGEDPVTCNLGIECFKIVPSLEQIINEGNETRNGKKKKKGNQNNLSFFISSPKISKMGKKGLNRESKFRDFSVLKKKTTELM